MLPFQNPDHGRVRAGSRPDAKVRGEALVPLLGPNARQPPLPPQHRLPVHNHLGRPSPSRLHGAQASQRTDFNPFLNSLLSGPKTLCTPSTPSPAPASARNHHCWERGHGHLLSMLAEGALDEGPPCEIRWQVIPAPATTIAYCPVTPTIDGRDFPIKLCPCGEGPCIVGESSDCPSQLFWDERKKEDGFGGGETRKKKKSGEETWVILRADSLIKFEGGT